MKIVDFEAGHADAWKSLNEAWIGSLFEIEAADRKVLDDPQGQVIDPGGHILMAVDPSGEPVGCAGLKIMADGGFEVIKMTVSDRARGTGLGRELMQACVTRASQLKARRLYLETNSSLAPALGLYRAFGFQDLPAGNTPYARADVFMELLFD
jgi:putative acetyltransferase